MTDKIGFTPAQAPDPAQGNAGQAPQDGNAQATTPAAANELTEARVQSIVESAIEGMLRKVQSNNAKFENRIKDEVTKRIADLSAAGVEVTPDQAKQLEKVVRAREEPQPTEIKPAAATPQAQPDGETVDPVTQAGYELMETLGVDLEDGDPEARLIDHSSSLKYLKSLETALEEKKARLGKARQPMGGGAPAANPIRNITDLDALFEMSRKKTR